MPISNKKLPLDGNSQLLEQLTSDFYVLATNGASEVPNERFYQITHKEESSVDKRALRKSFFNQYLKPINKVAFDTRRIDNIGQRIPRQNAQHWHRSDPFINQEMHNKIVSFTKLNNVLKEIEASYGGDPEYNKSYAKELHTHVKIGLRDGINDGDYFMPQLNYLEQMLYMRYRISSNNLNAMDNLSIKKAILSKDEVLLRRGQAIPKTEKKSEAVPVLQPKYSVPEPIKQSFEKKESTEKRAETPTSIPNGGSIIINNTPQETSKQANSQESMLSALFGGSDFRKGDKSVERIITIKIVDNVLK
jgi:hypothetical protein